MEVKNIFLTSIYNIQESKNVPILIKCLGHEGLRFVQTLNDEEKQKCKTSLGLFKVIRANFKPKDNNIILLLSYCKVAYE